jgi:hypothetical protein
MGGGVNFSSTSRKPRNEKKAIDQLIAKNK